MSFTKEQLFRFYSLYARTKVVTLSIIRSKDDDPISYFGKDGLQQALANHAYLVPENISGWKIIKQIESRLEVPVRVFFHLYCSESNSHTISAFQMSSYMKALIEGEFVEFLKYFEQVWNTDSQIIHRNQLETI